MLDVVFSGLSFIFLLRMRTARARPHRSISRIPMQTELARSLCTIYWRFTTALCCGPLLSETAVHGCSLLAYTKCTVCGGEESYNGRKFMEMSSPAETLYSTVYVSMHRYLFEYFLSRFTSALVVRKKTSPQPWMSLWSYIVWTQLACSRYHFPIITCAPIC